jgi:hypothetical protein
MTMTSLFFRKFKAKRSNLFVALVGLLAIGGCGNSRNSEATASTTTSGTLGSSGSRATVDPATTGIIRGTVKLDGAPPTLERIDMEAAPACVKANPSPVIPHQVVIGENGSLADVVVYVKSGLGNFHFDTPKAPVILEQKACMYEPHVIGLMTNQIMEVRNDDPTVHNVHVVAKVNPGWNRSQLSESPAIEQSFTRPDLAIPIGCNVHPWMRAFAFVFNHPYYAVTTRSGAFELKNLPPGTYTIEAWQERYGTQDLTVTTGPKETKVIAFTFQAASSAEGKAHSAGE